MAVCILAGVYYLTKNVQKYKQLWRDTLIVLANERAFRQQETEWRNKTQKQLEDANVLLQKVSNGTLSVYELNGIRSGVLPVTETTIPVQHSTRTNT